MNLEIEFQGSSVNALAVHDVLEESDAQVQLGSDQNQPASVTGGEVLVVFGLVIAGAKTAEFIVDVIYRIQQRFRPMAILDLTGEEPKLTLMEGAQGLRGELIVKTNTGEEITQTHGSEPEALELLKRFIPGDD